MIRYYCPDIETSLCLSEEESGHCCRVLRKKEGDPIHVVDGKGKVYVCRIVKADNKKTRFEIESSHSEPKHWTPKLVLAIAPTKNIDRIEWMIEKAVEIGVDKIVLIKCEHSERKNINIERLDRIVISAMKQSLKAVKPDLIGMMPYREFLSGVDTAGRFIGYCDLTVDRKEFVKEYDGNSDLTILIGPEGDFSPEEVSQAVATGFMPVTFGESRLRTETAGLYGVTAAHVLINLRK